MTTTGPRVIGLLGGMSWESSAEYYRLANELVRDRLGGLHSAQLVLALVDFADIERLLVHVQSRHLAAASGVPDAGQADGRDVQASLHVVHALGTRDRGRSEVPRPPACQPSTPCRRRLSAAQGLAKNSRALPSGSVKLKAVP